MEEGQTPDSVKGQQHSDQKLFMLGFQRQSEPIDYAEEEEEEEEQKEEKTSIKGEHIEEIHRESARAAGRSMIGRGASC